MSKNTIKAEFRVCITHVEPVEDGQIYVMWRRGVQIGKTHHSGKTEKVAVEGGGTVAPFKEFLLESTLLQKTKTMVFEEKQLGLTVKWIARPEGPSSSHSSSSSRSKRKSKKSGKEVKRKVLGKALVNLGELARNGVDSEITCAAGSARVTLRCHCDWVSYNGKRLIKSQGGGGKIEIGGVMYDGMQTERDMSDEDSASDLDMSDWDKSERGGDEPSYVDSSMGGAYDDDFGEPLEDPFGADAGISPTIPQIIVDITEYLQDKALDTQGLFRVNGQPDVIQLILSIYSAGYAVAKSEFANIHSTAGALKKYLRDADPLLTFELHDRFLEIVDQDTITGRIFAIQKLLPQLPQENLSILAYLCRFLTTLSLHKELNKMDASNISVVFGPNLMRPRTECTDMNQAFAIMSKTKVLVEILIDQSDAIFRSVLTLPSRSELEAVTFDQFRKREEAQHRKTNKLSRMLKRTSSIRKLAHSVAPDAGLSSSSCAFNLVVISVVDVPQAIYESSAAGGILLKWYRGAGKKDRGSSPVVKLFPSASLSLSSSIAPPAPSSQPPKSPRVSNSTPEDTRFYSADFQAVVSTLRFQGETTLINFQATLFKNKQGAFDPRPFTFKLCLATETTGTQAVKTLGHATLELAEYPPETTQQLAILTFVMKEARPGARRPKMHLRVTSRASAEPSSSPSPTPSSSSSTPSRQGSSKSSSKGSSFKKSGSSDLQEEITSLKARVQSLEAELAAKTELIRTKDLEMERMIEQMSKINALMANS